MNKILPLIFVLSFFTSTPLLQSSYPDITPALSDKIITRIRKMYIPIYKKYQGVESNRQVEIKTYNAKTNELLRTAHVHLFRKDYFYKEPEVKVLKYIVDGKEEKTSKYKPVSFRPGYHVFDENGDINYKTRVVGYKTIAGSQCYEIEVIPKKYTKLHYHGKLYYRVEDLKLVYSSGTLGKISFPLKELSMDLSIDFIDDLTVISSGVITVSVDIPVFFPDRRIVSHIKVINNKPIL